MEDNKEQKQKEIKENSQNKKSWLFFSKNVFNKVSPVGSTVLLVIGIVLFIIIVILVATNVV